MAYTVTVYVALPGTPLENGKTSQAGHVWYKIADTASNTSKSYGFQSVNGTPGGPGEVVDTDTKNYQNPYYSRTLEISREQYEQLKQYGEDGLQGNWSHFSSRYGGLLNSCVDFTWGGLNQAGLHANIKLPGLQLPRQGFEGSFQPMDNIKHIRSIQAPFPNSPLNRENHTPRPKQTFTQWLLTENEQQQQPLPTWDAQQSQAAQEAQAIATAGQATSGYFHASPGLTALSEKISMTFPQLDEEKVARLAAQGAWQCAREKMPVREVVDVEYMRLGEKDLLLMYNGGHENMVTADIRKALNTPVDQSLNAIAQVQQEQQWQAQGQQEVQQQAHSGPVLKV